MSSSAVRPIRLSTSYGPVSIARPSGEIFSGTRIRGRSGTDDANDGAVGSAEIADGAIVAV
jgi:hypothetical protein